MRERELRGRWTDSMSSGLPQIMPCIHVPLVIIVVLRANYGELVVFQLLF